MTNRFVFYPILFAIYFVVSSLSLMADQVPFSQANRLLIGIPISALLIMIAFFLRFRDWNRAGFITFLVIIWLLFFGHIYNVLIGLPLYGLIARNPFVVFGIWTLLLLFLVSGWTWTRIRNPHLISQALNVTAIIVLVLPVIKLSKFLVENNQSTEVFTVKSPIQRIKTNTPAGLYPDIYYIILDGYGRSDVLKEIYNFDNSDFLNYLRKRGFYIAGESTSNYVQTSLSLASSLNLEYLEGIPEVMGGSSNRIPLKNSIENSRSFSFLRSLGYEIVTFSSGYYYTELAGADIYMTPYEKNLNEFEQIAVSITPLVFLVDYLDLNILTPSYETHRTRIEYIFDEVVKVPNDERPRFFFVHVLAPHPPFVFGQQGEPISPSRAYNLGDGNHFLGSDDEYLHGYIRQLIYVNKLVADTVETIFEKSDLPPVIVIQGDHGPGMFLTWDNLEESCLWERSSILNAYYLPNSEGHNLYASITPANSFRVIFDSYLGTELDLIKDINYFSSWSHPYHFVDVTGDIDLKDNCKR